MPARAENGLLISTSERENTSIRESERGAVLEEAKASETAASEKKGHEIKGWSFRYGGKLSASYQQYQNLDHQKSEPDFLKSSRLEEAYFWFQMNMRSTHSVYVKLGDTYVDRDVGPTYTGLGADNEGPFLSLAHYQINFAREFNIPLRLTLGRQFLFMGTGVTYSAVNDGILAEVIRSPFYFKGLVAKTRPRQDNIDFSVPGYDKEGDRVFAGAELAYVGIKNSSIYSYALLQKDNSSENTDLARQNFHYNSHYWGAGFSSEPFKNLKFWSEIMFERGTDFTDTSRTQLSKSKIEAWGYVAGSKIRWDVLTHPVAEASFAYGSGDEDRTRVTNTLGGDLDGIDKNFLTFGYYQTGYALQPRLSNIKIVQVSGSLIPLENIPWIKENVLIGSRYYVYWKDKSAGGTSDTESTEAALFIGDELDLYLNWKINKDLLFSAKYGVFFPGDAFPESKRDPTQYLSTSLAYSF